MATIVNRVLQPARARSHQLALGLALIAAIVAGFIVNSGTQTAFSRTTSSADSSFVAATVNLAAVPRQSAGGLDNAAGSDVFTGTSTTTAASISDVIPGDSFTRYLKLRNSGSIAQNFSLVTTATDDAGGLLTNNGSKSLKLEIKQCDSSFSNCDATLYALGAPAISSPLAIASSVAAGSDVYLKIYLTLPSTVSDDGTGSTVQGKTATLNFTWTAVQSSSGLAR